MLLKSLKSASDSAKPPLEQAAKSMDALAKIAAIGGGVYLASKLLK